MEPNTQQSGLGAGTITLGSLLILVLAGLSYYFLRPTQPSISAGNKNEGTNDLDKPIEGVDPKADKAVGLLTDPQFFKGLNNFAFSIYNMVQDAKAKKKAEQGVSVYPQPQPVNTGNQQYVGPYSPSWYQGQ